MTILNQTLLLSQSKKIIANFNLDHENHTGGTRAYVHIRFYLDILITPPNGDRTSIDVAVNEFLDDALGRWDRWRKSTHRFISEVGSVDVSFQEDGSVNYDFYLNEAVKQ